MAETDGSIAIGISFKLDELKKSSDAALAEIQKLTVKFKEQGENSGNVYVKGFGKSTRQLNNMLNDFVKNMGNISPQMGQLGEKIASQFSKPIFAILPKLAMAFKTALPIIALIAGAIALVTKAVGGAVKAQKEFSDNVKLSYKAQAALADTLGKANKGISGQQKGVAVLSAALRQVSNIIDGVKKGFEGIANVAGSVLSWIANETGLMSEAQQEAAVKAQLLKEQNNALVESYEANKAELKKFKPR